MNYLLINHVPLGRRHVDGVFDIGDMWLEDLRAQASAAHDAGMDLTVACPLVENLDPAHSGSFNAVPIHPAEQGFEFVPLPHYVSLRQFLAARGELVRRLTQTIREADIVHCGYGGHPIPLGKLAWPIAQRLGKKRIWVFDGADPFPRLQLHAQAEPNPLKRLAKRLHTHRFERFCRRAIAEADLVFAHNAAVVERFRAVWNERCHQFDRSFVTDDTLIDDAQLGRRQAGIMDSAQPLRLIVAGRQITIKGTDHVLRALRRARDADAGLELDVLGDGQDLPRFKALADELKLGSAVRFIGAVPYGKALFDAWDNSHVMVITNMTAEISRNVLLAMARGLPLIMYSNPGTDALLSESGAGELVKQGDEAALAEALVSAARDRSLLARQSARGVAFARNHTLDATHHRRAQLAAMLLRSRDGRPQPSAGAGAVFSRRNARALRHDLPPAHRGSDDPTTPVGEHCAASGGESKES